MKEWASRCPSNSLDWLRRPPTDRRRNCWSPTSHSTKRSSTRCAEGSFGVLPVKAAERALFHDARAAAAAGARSYDDCLSGRLRVMVALRALREAAEPSRIPQREVMRTGRALPHIVANAADPLLCLLPLLEQRVVFGLREANHARDTGSGGSGVSATFETRRSSPGQLESLPADPAIAFQCPVRRPRRRIRSPKTAARPTRCGPRSGALRRRQAHPHRTHPT